MGTTLPLDTIEPPAQGVGVGGGARPNVKLPTNVAASKNCSVPDSLGAPIGAQALTKADILTSPETALTLALTVVVVVIAAFAKPGAPIIATQLSKENTNRRLACRAMGVDESLALVLPIFNLYKPTPLTALRYLDDEEYFGMKIVYKYRDVLCRISFQSRSRIPGMLPINTSGMHTAISVPEGLGGARIPD
jgi:hypothetical protein